MESKCETCIMHGRPTEELDDWCSRCAGSNGLIGPERRDALIKLSAMAQLAGRKLISDKIRQSITESLPSGIKVANPAGTICLQIDTEAVMASIPYFAIEQAATAGQILAFGSRIIAKQVEKVRSDLEGAINFHVREEVAEMAVAYLYNAEQGSMAPIIVQRAVKGPFFLRSRVRSRTEKPISKDDVITTSILMGGGEFIYEPEGAVGRAVKILNPTYPLIIACKAIQPNASGLFVFVK